MLRMIVVFCLLATTSIAQQYNYDIEGYDDNTGSYVYGEVDADSYGNVNGYIYLDDGTEVYVDGKFDGYGEMEVYGDDGNYYELEVEQLAVCQHNLGHTSKHLNLCTFSKYRIAKR